MNLAFHNDPALAEQVRARVKAHIAADEVVAGVYWDGRVGCFIGCLAHSGSVYKVEALTGFPTILTRIAELIFEGLPQDKRPQFFHDAMHAPRVGADLSLVAWKFLHWLVEDSLSVHDTDDVRAACALALQVVADKAQGVEVTSARAARAARAADAADTYAAYVAARAAAYVAAADTAADTYAAYAADAAEATRERQAAKLIELLEGAE